MSDDARAAERPESIGEWEDLLVRLEIAPRALRVALDDVPPGRLSDEVASRLDRLAGAERAAALRLAAMRGEASGSLPEEAPEDGSPEARARAGLERFTRVRSHVFNTVQRRGIDIWEWRDPEDGTTVFQLLTERTRDDGEVLATVRESARSREGGC